MAPSSTKKRDPTRDGATLKLDFLKAHLHLITTYIRGVSSVVLGGEVEHFGGGASPVLPPPPP